MKIDDFLKEKAFEHYKNGIDIIRDDFVSKNYERFLWKTFQEEMKGRSETSRKMSLCTDVPNNKYIVSFLNQFNEFGEGNYLFLFQPSTNPYYFIAREIVKRNNGRMVVLRNLFPEDDTINYLAVLDMEALDDIELLFHVLYPSNLWGNYGGYKLFGYDLSYYVSLCADDDIVYGLEYSKDNDGLFSFNGFAPRKDTNPYIIYDVRLFIESMIKKGFFLDEFDLYRNFILSLMPPLQKMYEKTRDYANASPTDWKFRKTMLLSELIARGEINKKWKSESSLFKLVKAQFIDAVFQYRPDWLAPQSLDIYIPSLRIGIEYQGIQHYESIDFFGGDEAFYHRQALDKRKQDRCLLNSVKLIEWNYHISLTPNNVKRIITDAIGT